MRRLHRPPLSTLLAVLLVLAVGLQGTLGQGEGHTLDDRLARRSRGHRRQLQADVAVLYSPEEDFPPELVGVSIDVLTNQSLASVSVAVLPSASSSATPSSPSGFVASEARSTPSSASGQPSSSTPLTPSNSQTPSTSPVVPAGSASAASQKSATTTRRVVTPQAAQSDSTTGSPTSAAAFPATTAVDTPVAATPSSPTASGSNPTSDAAATPSGDPAQSAATSADTSNSDPATAATSSPPSPDDSQTATDIPAANATPSALSDSSASQTVSDTGLASSQTAADSSATPTPYVTTTSSDPTSSETAAPAVPSSGPDAGNGTESSVTPSAHSSTTFLDTAAPTASSSSDGSWAFSSFTVTSSFTASFPTTTDDASSSPGASPSETQNGTSSFPSEPSVSASPSDSAASSPSDSSTAAPTSDTVSGSGNSTTVVDSFPSTTGSDSVASVTGTPDRGNASTWFGSSTQDSSSTWSSDTDSASSTASSDYASASASALASDAAYTPTASGLIVYTLASATSSSDVDSISTPTDAPTATTPSSTKPLPTTASIPSSIPTLIVPANSAVNQPDANTGNADDPLKEDTLISILLSADQYPWLFVVNSSDATSQLFNTFPALIASSLNITTDQVQTYGLMLYQPASWDGNQADLLTQWLAYIPSEYFSTLNAYVKTQGSPLYSQSGIQGELAAQINTAYPLAASNTPSAATTSASGRDTKPTRTRDIIIGVCVSVGGLLWLSLVYWIYKRVRKSNEKAVHKRMSEHMSMFSGAPAATGYGGLETADRRVSLVPSVAGSDIDDRPSSFYASPSENDATLRRQQRAAESEASSPFADEHESYGSEPSPGFSATISAPQTYGPSVFGQSWFANPDSGQRTPTHSAGLRRSGNPFEDMVTRSYLGTPSGQGGLTVPSSGGAAAQRRSAGPRKELQKGMIGQPQLQGSSLEYHGF